MDDQSGESEEEEVMSEELGESEMEAHPADHSVTLQRDANRP